MMIAFHVTKSKLEPDSMPFTEGQTGGEELEMQAAISSAISLKRIADTLDHIHSALVREVHTEQFAIFLGEKLDSISSSLSSQSDYLSQIASGFDGLADTISEELTSCANHITKIMQRHD